ncbi:uncharacterized protein Dana_GF22029 [Drosophila ananassae]|uniref:Glycosyltransferase family 92 protein n=1 Tax=Drosophila ananassae TaxID=7217 RepID=B3MYG9_DROAN|nr:uncharacterized protein LOC6504698 [Drosophila ananassae]EDV32663.1 uncharacterized protein Dana_GF22029 [Drosophila ananassae]
MTMRGGFFRLALLVVSSLFAFLLLLTALQHTDRLRIITSLDDKSNSKPPQQPQPHPVVQLVKITPPPVHHLEEPIDEELVLQLEQELPEVDYAFWYYTAKPKKYRYNATCGSYPDPLDLQLHNIYWQTFVNSNVTFRLYAAYLDRRDAVKLQTVRILATANQIGAEFPATQCQFWFEGNNMPVYVNVTEYVSVWVKAWGNKPQLNYPHLLSCPVPKELPPNLVKSLPRTVSLVANKCDRATNSLRINQQEKQSDPPKRTASQEKVLTGNATSSSQNITGLVPLNFGVCVKGFDFPYVDLSERLIEWFEIQRILGASKIYAYMYDVHPAVQRVLDYYQRTGYLELRPLTLANGMPRLRHYQHMLLQNRRLEKRLNELIPYNDCFYRNLYRHDFLVNVDVDEVIMPLNGNRNWDQLVHTAYKMEEEKGGKCAGRFPALCFINTYFTKVEPELRNHEEQAITGELYMLQHTLRHRNHSLPGRATKCFHNARLSLTLHNHFTLKWLPGACNPRTIDISVAQMHHYREPDSKYTNQDLVEDRSVWPFATELKAAVEQVWLHMDDVLAQVSDPEEQEEMDVALDQEGESEVEMPPPVPVPVS